MPINDDPLDPDIDEGAVREVLEGLMDLLDPLDPRLGFAQRVAEICMILYIDASGSNRALSNWDGIRDLTYLTYDEIDDRLKEIDADYHKTISS